MICHRCDSDKVISISAKCSDMFSATLGNMEHNGYVRSGIGIGSGDYVEFSYCADCGQIQGSFPVCFKARKAKQY